MTSLAHFSSNSQNCWLHCFWIYPWKLPNDHHVVYSSEYSAQTCFWRLRTFSLILFWGTHKITLSLNTLSVLIETARAARSVTKYQSNSPVSAIFLGILSKLSGGQQYSEMMKNWKKTRTCYLSAIHSSGQSPHHKNTELNQNLNRH